MYCKFQLDKLEVCSQCYTFELNKKDRNKKKDFKCVRGSQKQAEIRIEEGGNKIVGDWNHLISQVQTSAKYELIAHPQNGVQTQFEIYATTAESLVPIDPSPPQVYKVKHTENPDDTMPPAWTNLPDSFRPLLLQFSSEMQNDEPLEVLQTIIKNIDTASQNCQIKSKGFVLPKQADIRKEFEKLNIFKTEDLQEKYQCLSARLGGGATCSIFRVKRKSDDKVMIGKMIQPENDDIKRMIFDEVGILQLNAGQNSIIKCYDSLYWQKKQMYWMFLEPMDGDLLQIVTKAEEKKIKFDEDFCKYVVYRCLEALVFLHDRKIIHRDIKSDNLLFSRNGDIKLGDFGTAKTLTEEESKGNEILGTICYMSPELLSEQPYDEQTDIWSLGILCIELANRERPFIDISQPEEMLKQLQNETPSLTGDWSNEFKNFVSSCLITNVSKNDQPKRAQAQQLRMHKWLQGAQNVQEKFAVDIEQIFPKPKEET